MRFLLKSSKSIPHLALDFMLQNQGLIVIDEVLQQFNFSYLVT